MTISAGTLAYDIELFSEFTFTGASEGEVLFGLFATWKVTAALTRTVIWVQGVQLHPEIIPVTTVAPPLCNICQQQVHSSRRQFHDVPHAQVGSQANLVVPAWACENQQLARALVMEFAKFLRFSEIETFVTLDLQRRTPSQVALDGLFQGLPSGLQHLEIHMRELEVRRSLIELPAGLLSLGLDLSHAYCTLVERMCSISTVPGIAAARNLFGAGNTVRLPPTLKRLDPTFNFCTMTAGLWEAYVCQLPAGLEHLCLSLKSVDVGTLAQANLNLPIEGAAKGVSTQLTRTYTRYRAGRMPGDNLAITCERRFLDLGKLAGQLPAALHFFSLNLRGSHMTRSHDLMAHLPPMLGHLFLSLSYVDFPSYVLSPLPSGLEDLTLSMAGCPVHDAHIAKFLRALPRGLQRLDWNIDDTEVTAAGVAQVLCIMPSANMRR